jgi:hypothetical protein
MVRHLTNDELRNVVHIKSRREFDLAIAESHGPPETEVDFPVDACHQSTKILSLTTLKSALLMTQTLKTQNWYNPTGDNLSHLRTSDPDGNQYVLLEALVEHRRNDKASYYYAMSMIPLL